LTDNDVQYSVISDYSFDEFFDVLSNPVVLHYAGEKPNTKRYRGPLALLQKWWECHALTPFADPERDALRMEEIIGHRRRHRSPLCSHANYFRCFLVDDWREAIDRLKHFSANGCRIAFYGAGRHGTMFAAIARSMGLTPDKVCDLNRCGQAIGGVPIEPPSALKPAGADTVVALAIEDPQLLLEAKSMLLGFGFPENRILPVFEHLAMGGRKWDKILGSLAPTP
jgi:hypothetical protein